MDELRSKLAETANERDEAVKMIRALKEELRLQEAHYSKMSGTQGEYYAKLVEKSLADERKVSELMAKLNAEQFEFNKYKNEHGKNTKISDDVGAQ
jgi:predicted  nucleic acid-binding Zn-ribbon protein